MGDLVLFLFQIFMVAQVMVCGIGHPFGQRGQDKLVFKPGMIIQQPEQFKSQLFEISNLAGIAEIGFAGEK